jgi:hypothetical protein
MKKHPYWPREKRVSHLLAVQVIFIAFILLCTSTLFIPVNFSILVDGSPVAVVIWCIFVAGIIALSFWVDRIILNKFKRKAWLARLIREGHKKGWNHNYAILKIMIVFLLLNLAAVFWPIVILKCKEF